MNSEKQCLAILAAILSFGLSAEAKLFNRKIIEPIGFTTDEKFIYRANDEECVCKENVCNYEDESGAQSCLRSQMQSIDIKTDKTENLKDDNKIETKALLPSSKLLAFPVKKESDEIQAELGPDCNREYESFTGNQTYYFCELYLVSQKLGRKKISSVRFHPSPGHSFRTLGYFAHPNEKKIVVLWEEASRQFEENMQIYQHLAGANLLTGFKSFKNK